MIVDTDDGLSLQIARDFQLVMASFPLFDPINDGVSVRQKFNQYDVNYSTNGFRYWATIDKVPRYFTHLHLTLKDEACYINSMSIDSNNGWRKGLGSNLLNLIEEFAKKRNCSFVSVFPTGVYMVPFFDKKPDYIKVRDGREKKLG